jgi:hypothetical protein
VGLPRAGKRGEALEKSTGTILRIFETRLHYSILLDSPLNAYIGINRAYSTPIAVADLAKVCKLYYVRVEVKENVLGEKYSNY